MRVLVVGERLHEGAIARQLRLHRIGVDAVSCGEEAFEYLRLYDYSAVLATMHLPDMDGETLIRRLGADDHAWALIVMEFTGNAQGKARALNFGADDVLTGPVDGEELVARIRAILRRQKGHTQTTLQAGDLQLHLQTRTMSAAGQPVPLTQKEFELLELLFLRKGDALPRETLLSNLYGGIDFPHPKSIDVLICRIRKKLVAAGAVTAIDTVRGAGYTLSDARGKISFRSYQEDRADIPAAA